MDNDRIYQILDINLNRLAGAFRLLEDFCRVSYPEPCSIALKLKLLRHNINRIYPYDLLIKARDVESDQGKFFNTDEEIAPKRLADVVIANFKRINESFRVIEELCKTLPEHSAKVIKIKELRFLAYRLEKEFYTGLKTDDEQNK